MNLDIVLKKLFSNEEVFSDFANAIFYEGKNVVQPLFCSPCDAATITNGMHVMDVVKKVRIQDEDIFIGIENQLVCDDSMPLRILESIAGFSKRERIAIQRRNKKEKILKTNKEIISGFKSKDKIHEFHCIVFYVGQEEWDVRNELKSLFHTDFNFKIHVVELRKDELAFKTDVLKHLFYGSKCIFEKRYKDLKEIEITYDEAVLIAQVTNSYRILKPYIEKQKGEWIDMCKAMEELVNESIEKGIERGRAQGIEQGRAQGIEQGRAQGIEQGRAQGIEQGRSQGIEQGATIKEKSMYEKLLENGQTVQQIAALFGYTVEYVQSVLSGKTKMA